VPVSEERLQKAKQVDHVYRAVPPWRRGALLTECGLDPQLYSTISRDAFVSRVQDMGKTRAAMTMCMTCWETAARRTSWARDPAAVMARECSRWDKADKARITAELRALEALVTAHEDEFYGYLDGLEETVDLRARRQRRAVDRARGVDPRGPRPL
jgi:hypothetical protein